MGLLDCPETSVINFQSTMRNVSENLRSYLHRSGSLKSPHYLLTHLQNSEIERPVPLSVTALRSQVTINL